MCALPGARRDDSGAARFRTAGRGITDRSPAAPRFRTGSPPKPKPARRYRSWPPGKWTSSRSGWTTAMACIKKLTPALYGAIIDEAHKNGLRVTAHIFDARGREGPAASGHRRLRARRARQGHRRGVRGADEGTPEGRPRAEPARSRRRGRPELAERQRAGRGVEEAAGRGDRPPGRATGVRDPGAQPGQAQCRGRADRARDRRRHRLEPPPRDGGHGRRRDDAGRGHRRPRRATRPIFCGCPTSARFSRARARTSSCSTRIRSTTSPTRGGSMRSICAARPLTAPPCGRA